MEPYISLYAKPAAGEKEEDDDDNDDDGEKKDVATKYLNVERPPMWALIEKTREEGKQALEKLQNRLPESDKGDASSSAKGSKKKSKSGKGKKRNNDDDSDGGFFEE